MQKEFKLQIIHYKILFSVFNIDLYGVKMLEVFSIASDTQIQINEGSLYPALHKLERAGLVRSYQDKASSEELEERRRGKPRVYYSITEAGRIKVIEYERMLSNLKELSYQRL